MTAGYWRLAQPAIRRDRIRSRAFMIARKASEAQVLKSPRCFDRIFWPWGSTWLVMFAECTANGIKWSLRLRLVIFSWRAAEAENHHVLQGKELCQ